MNFKRLGIVCLSVGALYGGECCHAFETSAEVLTVVGSVILTVLYHAVFAGYQSAAHQR